jgi:hypothetical protein
MRSRASRISRTSASVWLAIRLEDRGPERALPKGQNNSYENAVSHRSFLRRVSLQVETVRQGEKSLQRRVGEEREADHSGTLHLMTASLHSPQ